MGIIMFEKNLYGERVVFSNDGCRPDIDGTDFNVYGVGHSINLHATRSIRYGESQQIELTLDKNNIQRFSELESLSKLFTIVLNSKKEIEKYFFDMQPVERQHLTEKIHEPEPDPGTSEEDQQATSRPPTHPKKTKWGQHMLPVKYTRKTATKDGKKVTETMQSVAYVSMVEPLSEEDQKIFDMVSTRDLWERLSKHLADVYAEGIDSQMMKDNK